MARHVPELDAVPDGAVELDEVDHRMWDRAAIDRLVEATGASVSTVRRRLGSLRSSGVLRFDVDVDPSLQRLTTRTLVFAQVAPAFLERAGEQVAGHEEVGFAAAVTGTGNLFASVSTADLPALYEYLSVRLGELEGLRSSSTTPVLRTVKAATTRYSARVSGTDGRSVGARRA